MASQGINPFEARWSASGNNLCLGKWVITYCGKALELGAQRNESDMGTFGVFSWIFPDDEDLAEGLPEDQWIAENADWLNTLFSAHGIPADEEQRRWFYRAVNAQDWRCGSCGGCL